MVDAPLRHTFLSRLLDGDLSFAELAHFAGQYHYVVSERHTAECIVLGRVHSRGNGRDGRFGGGSLARLWLQFTLAVGGAPCADPLLSTRACARELNELSGASVRSAAGVVVAIGRMEGAMAERFCDQRLRDSYELHIERAVEYFEQWNARRDLWVEAAGRTIDHPDALAAEAAANTSLRIFLDGLTAPGRSRAAAR